MIAINTNYREMSENEIPDDAVTVMTIRTVPGANPRRAAERLALAVFQKIDGGFDPVIHAAPFKEMVETFINVMSLPEPQTIKILTFPCGPDCSGAIIAHMKPQAA